MKNDIAASPTKNYKSLIVKQCIFALFGITLLYFLIRMSGLSFNELYDRCSNIEHSYILLILAFAFLTLLLKSIRWSLIVRILTDKDKLPRGFFFYYTCISTLMTQIISQAFVNIGVKTLSLKYKQNVNVIEGSSTGVIEHVLNILVILASVLPSFLFVTKIIPIPLAIALSLILIICILVLTNYYYYLLLKYTYAIISFVYKIIGKIPFLKRFASYDLSFTDATSEIKKTCALKLLIFSVLIYYALLIRYYIYGGALGIDIPFFQLVLTFPIVYIINAIGITPGSIGISEFGWFGVLLFIGVGREDASIYIISQRIFSIISILIVSIFGYIYYSFETLSTSRAKIIFKNELKCT